ncbi:HAUS augmin-like complex subunit 6 N-terminus-domain-containing protein [Obelidium mucronatum]|nr:HAUS augmin-like complex subunit 6 N-terminus-domain-containing protein [Obelidium mucronatum]
MTNVVRQSVFSALSLLGFESPTISVETLFAKGAASANPKAFEAVAYFLLCQSGCRCVDAELFRTCFPVLDRSQSRDFRNNVAKALELLKKNGALPASLQIRRSYFDDCKGERFEQALLALTTHVLSCTMSREYESCISPLPEPFDESTTLRDMQTAIDRLEAQFRENVASRDEETKEWVEYGSYLSQEFCGVLVELEKLSEIKKEMEANPIFVDGQGYSEYQELQKIHSEKLDAVRSLWKDCLAWIEANKANIDIISSVLDDRANTHFIDGSESRLEIPHELSEQFRKEIQAERITPYSEDGMLDLVSVVKLLDFSVKTADETLESVALLNKSVLD